MSTSSPRLPDGWRWSTLAELADVVGGLAKGKKRPAKSRLRSVPYLRVANVQRGHIDLTEVKTIEATENEVQDLRLLPGDVLLNEGGDRDKLGRGWVWKGQLPECIHQNHVFRARVREAALLPELLSHYANSAGQHYFTAQGKQTTNLASISLGRLRGLPVPVPPVDQQAALLSTIDSHFSRLDAATATLERVQRNLDRYRASVLKAAVEGRLVPTEAELARKEGRSYEPAAFLLKRILAERRRRWEEAELAKLKAKGKPPTDDRWKSKYEEPAAPDDDGLPELPEGWCWARAEQCVEMQVGHAFKSAGFLAEGVNLLRGDNIGHGRLRWDDDRRRCIRPEALAEYRHLALAVGDIVLAMDRPVISTGLKSATVRASDLPALLVQRVIRLRPNIDRDYFLSILGSPPFLGHVTSQAKGGGVPHVSENQIGDFTFAVPPLAEQRRIAEVADRLLVSSATALGAAKVGVRRTARLRQSILKWAFEGRLVDSVSVGQDGSERSAGKSGTLPTKANLTP